MRNFHAWKSFTTGKGDQWSQDRLLMIFFYKLCGEHVSHITTYYGMDLWSDPPMYSWSIKSRCVWERAVWTRAAVIVSLFPRIRGRGKYESHKQIHKYTNLLKKENPCHFAYSILPLSSKLWRTLRSQKKSRQFVLILPFHYSSLSPTPSHNVLECASGYLSGTKIGTWNEKRKWESTAL